VVSSPSRSRLSQYAVGFPSCGGLFVRRYAYHMRQVLGQAVGFPSCGELSVTQQASHTRWVFGRAEGFPSRGKLSATKSVDLAVGARIARVYRSYL
jgi:hypothetical protein